MPAEQHRAWIALGANLGDIKSNLRTALDSLASIPGTALVATSPWYRNRPIGGPSGQPDYINGVAEVRTTLEPHTLLAALRHIEDAAGRARTERWAARTLDLDLLLYDSLTLDSQELTLPHPRLKVRNFVVFPLFDIAPSLLLPDGTDIAALRRQLGDEGLFAAFADLDRLDER